MFNCVVEIIFFTAAADAAVVVLAFFGHAFSGIFLMATYLLDTNLHDTPRLCTSAITSLGFLRLKYLYVSAVVSSFDVNFVDNVSANSNDGCFRKMCMCHFEIFFWLNFYFLSFFCFDLCGAIEL
jgi:hypothetical protein